MIAESTLSLPVRIGVCVIVLLPQRAIHGIAAAVQLMAPQLVV
jgi:hypothetical protein